jgi:hypothetical protein
MKTKIMLAIFMLIAIKNFAQDISLTISKNDFGAMQQRQILYKEMINDEISYCPANTEKNLMRSSIKQPAIATDLVVPQKHSVWKSAGIGMVTGLLIGAILGAVTANPDELFYSYTAAEGALAFGAFGAAFGGVSGLIVGVIQNATSKKTH